MLPCTTSQQLREKRVDIGQFVRRGDEIAGLYAIEYAEVPLPIPDRDLAFLDLIHPFRDSLRDELQDGPVVRLQAEFAGVRSEWTGRLVRTAAEIDARSRTVTVIARVDDPYGRKLKGPSLPLPVGLFVASYYHAILLGCGLLWRRLGDGVGLLLCLLSIATHVGARLWPDPVQMDTRFAWNSVATVGVVLALTGLALRHRRQPQPDLPGRAQPEGTA